MPVWLKHWSWLAAVGLVSLGRSAAAAGVEVEEPEACDQVYDDHVGWTAQPPAAELIALGAVLPLPISLDLFGEQADAAISFLEVNVIDSDGNPVPGAVESLDPAGQSVAWRAEAILSPEVTYEVRLFVDNEAMRSSAETRFLGEAIEFETLWSFSVSDEAPTVVDWEAVEVRTQYTIVETISKSGLVCCDGAYPTFDIKADCTDLEGTCGSRHARAEARGFVELASHPATAGFNTALDLGSWSDRSGLACVTVTRTDRTSGAQDEREFCQELEGPLGPIEDYDVEARLAEVCDGVPYRCDVVLAGDWGDEWDSENCWPSTDEDPSGKEPRGIGPGSRAGDTADPEPGIDGGCGCRASSGPTPLAVSGLLMLLFGLRRRAQREACRIASSQLRSALRRPGP